MPDNPLHQDGKFDHAALARLASTLKRLRSPTGCSWDQRQTAHSLKPHLVEEVYEVLDAIDHGQPQDVCSELGDLLMLVFFITELYAEQGQFTLSDVATTINNKMIRRHPHVFESATFYPQPDPDRQWQEIKQREREDAGDDLPAAMRVPKHLPALKYAQQISALTTSTEKNAAALPELAYQLISAEPAGEAAAEQLSHQQQILGKTLLSCVELANHLQIDAEECLRITTNQRLHSSQSSSDER